MLSDSRIVPKSFYLIILIEVVERPSEFLDLWFGGGWYWEITKTSGFDIT